VTRVRDIHLDHLAECCPVFTVDLPEPSEAGQGVYARPLFRRITFKFPDGARSRSDQTHFSLQYIEDLRQLIETSCSQKLPAKDETRISGCVQFDHRTIANNQMLKVSLMNMSLGIHLHGAKFYEHETATLESDPRLPVKNGPGRSDCDPQCDQRHYRQPDQEQERDHGQVDKSFPFGQGSCEFLARARVRRKRCLGIAAMKPCHFGDELMEKTSNLSALLSISRPNAIDTRFTIRFLNFAHSAIHDLFLFS